MRRAIAVRGHVPHDEIGCTHNRGPVIAIRESSVPRILIREDSCVRSACAVLRPRVIGTPSRHRLEILHGRHAPVAMTGTGVAVHLGGSDVSCPLIDLAFIRIRCGHKIPVHGIYLVTRHDGVRYQQVRTAVRVYPSCRRDDAPVATAKSGVEGGGIDYLVVAVVGIVVLFLQSDGLVALNLGAEGERAVDRGGEGELYV